MSVFADRLVVGAARRPGTTWLMVGGMSALAVALGYQYVSRPFLVQAVAALLVAPVLLLNARAGVLFFVIGTVTVFGPQELTTTKLAFLFGVGIALVGALGRSRHLTGTGAYDDLRPLLRASAVLLFVVALGLFVARLNDVPDKDALRDAAPYVLLAFAPLFALDAQAAFSLRALRRLIAVVGLLGAITFTLRWYERRDIASAATGEVGLMTLLLTAALFSFALAVALDGDRGRGRWLALGALAFAMLATTGTRSVAVLLAALPAIVLGTRRHLARRALRLAVALPITALLVILAAQTLLRAVEANEDAVSRRIEVLMESGTQSDESYVNRVNSVRGAWDVFVESPVFGSGPGSRIPWTSAGGERQADTFVDTPVGFLADYGLVGIVAVAILAGAFVSCLRRLRRRSGARTTAQLALIGFAAVIVAYSVLQVPFEDKGLAVGMMLLLACAAREVRELDGVRRTVHERPR